MDDDSGSDLEYLYNEDRSDDEVVVDEKAIIDISDSDDSPDEKKPEEDDYSVNNLK